MPNAEFSGNDVQVLEELFSSGPVVIFKWINAENWPVAYVTANVTQVFGQTAQALTTGAVTYASLIHPDDLQRVVGEVTKANASGVASFQTKDYRIRRPDGAYRWIEDHTRIVRDDDGIITHYIGYVFDVTERRRTEEARRDSEARYRTMLSTTPLGYWLIDEDTMTVEVNPALCRMLGYSADELVGRSPFDFLTEDGKKTFSHQVAIRAPGDQRTYELMLKTKDGRLIHALMHATTLPDTITTARSFAMVTDITDIVTKNDAAR